MSSPLDRDFGPDEPSPYAPKWVREAADARRGQTDERRPIAPKPAENVAGERSAPASGAANEPMLVDRYRLPPSLEPTLMPEPWPVPRTRSALGLVARFAVAAGIAAVIALFVVGKFPTSWLGAGKGQQPDSPSFGSRFSGQNAQQAEQPKSATPKIIPALDARRAAGGSVPPAGAAPTRATESAAPPMPTNPAPQPPAAAAVQSAPAAAKSFPIRQLEREEIADLMRRGEEFIATGDLASARLVLQRAAEGGDPRAALTLAGTYDPIVLERLGIQGFASDIAAARSWYERAKEFGSAEAMRRLEMLASQAR
jgi:hypothetical protein